MKGGVFNDDLACSHVWQMLCRNQLLARRSKGRVALILQSGRRTETGIMSGPRKGAQESKMTRRIITYADNLDNVLVLKWLAGNWVAHFRPDDATDAIHCDHAVPKRDGKGSHGFVRDNAERWRASLWHETYVGLISAISTLPLNTVRVTGHM